jgi:RHS repeat-associated protein
VGNPHDRSWGNPTAAAGEILLTVDTTADAYVYDAAGNRVVQARDNGGDGTFETATLYLDGLELTRNGATVTATRYYTLAAATVALRTPTALQWLGGDPNGSLAVATDLTGATIRQRYDPYGKRRGATDIAGTDRGYLTKPHDPTGLVQLGARYYDPTLSVFLSVDPLAQPDDPRSLNPYRYANNNPTTYTDPTGLRPTCDTPADCNSLGWNGNTAYRNSLGRIPAAIRRPATPSNAASNRWWMTPFTPRWGSAPRSQTPTSGAQERTSSLLGTSRNIVPTLVMTTVSNAVAGAYNATPAARQGIAAEEPRRGVGALIDWMKGNSERAHENSSLPGWVRFSAKASVAVLAIPVIEGGCFAGIGAAPATGGASLGICVGAIGFSYLTGATVGYVVDNNEDLSWDGWLRSLSPDKQLEAWLQWPPW